MSLKQFPYTSDDSKAGKQIPARMVANLFDPQRAWNMIEKRRERMDEDIDVGGFGNIKREFAEQIANAAGIRITKGFSIPKAVQIFRKSKFRELRAYAAFLLLFTISTYYHRDFGQGNALRTSLQVSIFNTKYLASESGQLISFDGINSIQDFWDFWKACLISNLFLSNSECTDDCDQSFGLHYLLHYNQIIQPLRIRQLRVNSIDIESCDVALDMIVAGDNFRCWPSYSPQNENRSDIVGWPNGVLTKYSSAETIRTSPYGRNSTTTYDGGGFVLDFRLGITKKEILQILDHLKQSQYIDFATRAVFVDVCLYNPSVQFFTSVRILFEFLPYGDVRASSSIQVMKGAALPNSLEDAVLFYIDVVVYVLLVLFIFWDLKRIATVGWLHFRAFWNWISMLNYIIFSYTFIQRFLYLNLEPIRAFTEKLAKNESLQKVYDFHAVGDQYQYISVLTGISAFLCWIRILSYFRYFDRDLSLLVSTIGNCATDTLSWFLTMSIVIFAFAQAFFLAFGPEVDGFDTVAQSVGTLCEWMFRRVNAADIIAVDQ